MPHYWTVMMLLLHYAGVSVSSVMIHAGCCQTVHSLSQLRCRNIYAYGHDHVMVGLSRGMQSPEVSDECLSQPERWFG